ncbi:MAG TPA: hypothetical protein VGG91_18255 [Myxococcaceae bacterium]|jgi:hypothetical protein
MTTQTHRILVPATRSLIAAFVLIVSLGVLALAAQFHFVGGSMQVPSPDAVAEWGD